MLMLLLFFVRYYTSINANKNWKKTKTTDDTVTLIYELLNHFSNYIFSVETLNLRLCWLALLEFRFYFHFDWFVCCGYFFSLFSRFVFIVYYVNYVLLLKFACSTKKKKQKQLALVNRSVILVKCHFLKMNSIFP